MNNLFMIHMDDYTRHISDKMELYDMLRQLEDAIGKLPECVSTAEVRQYMAALSPRLDELQEDWNTPRHYLVSAEPDKLGDVPETGDAEYFSEGGNTRTGGDASPAPELASHELLLALTDTADKLYDNYAALIELARRQLHRCEQ